MLNFCCSLWAGFQSAHVRTNILISKHATFVLDDTEIAILPHSPHLPLLWVYISHMSIFWKNIFIFTYYSDFGTFCLVRKAFRKMKVYMGYHSNTYAVKHKT